MGNNIEACKNCEQNFNINYEFCPYCGQEAKDKLTVGVLFKNTISNYFSVDARFFKSFLPLLLKPGYLAKTFVEGKRLLYLHPAKLYLFISVVFFFLMSVLIVKNNVSNIDRAIKNATVKPYVPDSLKTEATKALDSIKIDSILRPLKAKGMVGLDEAQIKALDSIIKSKTSSDSERNQLDFGYNSKKVDSLIAIGANEQEIFQAMGMNEDANALTRKFYAQTLKFHKNRSGGQIFQAIYDTIPIALFVLLPIFAFILKLFYYNSGSYAHHLVFSFYFFSFLFTVFSITLITNYFVNIPGWLDVLIVLSTFFYLVIGVKNFYERGFVSSFVKSGVISFLYLIVVIPIAVIILFIIGFLFY